ncbi:MAG: hypothetical protein U0233_00950 [Nitrospira sp.]|jgi:hypothetical protein|nr:hypothetical protein [Nitrospira sp.]
MNLLKTMALMLMLLLTGCLGRPAQLLPVGSHTILNTDQLEAEWPQGWMTLRPAEKDEEAAKQGLLFVVTHDGFSLQSMRLAQRSIEGEFKHTQKKLSVGMLPQEAAAILLDDIRADSNMVDFTIIENGPTILAGSQGFKIKYAYRSKSGLRRQSVMYGCLDKGMLITLTFDAPQRHYFALDLPTFEKVKDSLRWKS